MVEKKPIHILLRYSDRLYKVGNVIERHNRVIQTQGSVWFGKLGRPVGKIHIKAVNQQCASGIPTYLYLVQRIGKRYVAHRGTILRMSKALPPEEEHLVPKYYFDVGIVELIQLWTQLSKIEPLERSHLGRLRALSSVTSIPETLARSMAAHFIVRETAHPIG